MPRCAPKATSARWTFRTRDRYRHAIEELCAGFAHTELEVARAGDSAAKRAGSARPQANGSAVAAARAAAIPAITSSAKGRRRIREAELGFRVPTAAMARPRQCGGGHSGLSGNDRDHHRDHRSPLPCSGVLERGGGWLLCFWGSSPSFPASDAAVALVNRAVDEPVRRRAILPGLELRDGVPAEPAHDDRGADAPDHPAAIEEQIERLEVHHLASPRRRSPLRAALGLDGLRHGDAAEVTTSLLAPPARASRA